MRYLASMLLVAVGLVACGEGGSSSGAGGSGGDGGSGGSPVPAKPLVWEALPTTGAPAARYFHSAVWTGSKMVVWGGLAGPVTDAGGAYDPAAKTWSATSAAGAPEARHSHTAVWTGSKMLVWGGYGKTGLAVAGGIYDPAADAWKPMSTANQPSPRQGHSAVWTGQAMVVWGGFAGAAVLGSGGSYDPATDTWTPLATASAPSGRYDHGAVWTGSKMLVWSGYNQFDWLHDGASWSPGASGGTWLGALAAAGAPSGRQGATAVWTSKELLVWGGWTGGPYEDTGGLFSPGSGTGSWIPTTKTDAPSARGEQVGVWSGSDLVIWGGCGGDSCGQILGDGGRFVPSASGGIWTPVATQDALPARRGATGVVTGTAVLVWGGRTDSTTALASGATAPL